MLFAYIAIYYCACILIIEVEDEKLFCVFYQTLQAMGVQRICYIIWSIVQRKG